MKPKCKCSKLHLEAPEEDKEDNPKQGAMDSLVDADDFNTDAAVEAGLLTCHDTSPLVPIGSLEL